MGYLVIARKWRPQGFDAIVGQQHVTRTLKNAIAGNRIAHAFLFSGPRGVGKTTTARILAKALNCEQGPIPDPCNQCDLCREITSGSSLDIIEIDGASNNSVDDIRDLRERVRYTPTKAKYKVYIIDEVHMLSTSAFNALLKTLEEPPAHVIFVMATTEPQKIPATILSRCQHFAFRRIPTNEILSSLEAITNQEEVKISHAALAQIARAADGSLRDGQSILEQVISYGDEVSEETVLDLLGVLDRNLLEGIANAIIQKDATQVLLVLDQIVNSGYSLGAFHQQLLEYFRNLMIVKISGDESLISDLPDELKIHLTQQSENISQEELSLVIKLLLEAGEVLKKAPQPRVVLELYLSRLAQLDSLLPLSQILERLINLEKKLAQQGFQALPKENKPNPQLNLNTVNNDTASKPIKNTIENTENNQTEINTSPQNKPAQKTRTSPKIFANNHDLWAEVVAKVEEQKPPLAAVLCHGTILEIQDGTVKVAFDSPLWYNKLGENNNKILLISALEECLRQSVKLELREEPLPAGASLADHKEQLEEKQSANLKKQAMAEPIVSQAMEIFQANLLDVKELSPNG